MNPCNQGDEYQYICSYRGEQLVAQQQGRQGPNGHSGGNAPPRGCNSAGNVAFEGVVGERPPGATADIVTTSFNHHSRSIKASVPKGRQSDVPGGSTVKGEQKIHMNTALLRAKETVSKTCRIPSDVVRMAPFLRGYREAIMQTQTLFVLQPGEVRLKSDGVGPMPLDLQGQGQGRRGVGARARIFRLWVGGIRD